MNVTIIDSHQQEKIYLISTKVTKSLQLMAFLVAGISSQLVKAESAFFAKAIDYTNVVSSVVRDFNQDGHDDFLICGHDPKDKVWYWTPQGYMPAAKALPSNWGDRHGCDSADVNQDGRMDLYCMHGADQGGGYKSNQLYIQQQNGSLALKQGDFGAEDHWGRGRYPIFFKFNNDQYPDLYITNFSTPREDGIPNINRVYVNSADGSGTFQEVTTNATGPYGSKCIGKGDWNKDGFDDLVTCNDFYIKPGKLFENNGLLGFTDVTNTIYNGNALWKDAVLKDVNKDGLDDLIIISSNNYLELRLNSGDGTRFSKVDYSEKLAYNANKVVVADVNHDSVNDLYIVRSYKCGKSSVAQADGAPDILYLGPSWVKILIPQKNPGCGSNANVVDGDKILLMNGGWNWQGTNELVGDWDAFIRAYGLTPLSN